MDSLLAVADEQLTADRLADAMKLRDEESSNQHYRTRLTGDHLRILLVICSAAVIAFLPFMLLSGKYVCLVRCCFSDYWAHALARHNR